MRIYIIYIVFLLFAPAVLFSQVVSNNNIPERTPEQETASQTNRLKRELGLTPEQLKKVYEINLYYARQRQRSNSRMEAVERVKNKNKNLKYILSNDQYKKLQNKHYDRLTNTNRQIPAIESSVTSKEAEARQSQLILERCTSPFSSKRFPLPPSNISGGFQVLTGNDRNTSTASSGNNYSIPQSIRKDVSTKGITSSSSYVTHSSENSKSRGSSSSSSSGNTRR